MEGQQLVALFRIAITEALNRGEIDKQEHSMFMTKIVVVDNFFKDNGDMAKCVAAYREADEILLELTKFIERKVN